MKYLLSFIILFGTPTSVQASDENGEIFCLAKNMYFEAGNQPIAGKIAVGHVVMNRVYSMSYPDTVCDVIYQAKWHDNWKGTTVPVRNMCQFSWFCDGKSDIPEDSDTWMHSLMVATSFLNGDWQDITEGSTHYHADSVHPYWAASLNQTVIINNHIFYK
jgi:spore germination cell wall hydrolase CwlJ-like protein